VGETIEYDEQGNLRPKEQGPPKRGFFEKRVLKKMGKA
jgi:hypothetical protein